MDARRHGIVQPFAADLLERRLVAGGKGLVELALEADGYGFGGAEAENGTRFRHGPFEVPEAEEILAVSYEAFARELVKVFGEGGRTFVAGGHDECFWF